MCARVCALERRRSDFEKKQLIPDSARHERQQEAVNIKAAAAIQGPQRASGQGRVACFSFKDSLQRRRTRRRRRPDSWLNVSASLISSLPDPNAAAVFAIFVSADL